MNKSKKILFYIIGGCSSLAAVFVIFLPLVSGKYFRSFEADLFDFYDFFELDETIALFAVLITIIALTAVVNSLFAFIKKGIPVAVFSGFDLLGAIVIVICVFAFTDGHGIPGIGIILYSVLSIANLVMIIVQFKTGKNSSSSESYFPTEKTSDDLSFSHRYYDAENILTSSEVKTEETHFKSDMPWDSEESIYDETSSYFSDIEKEKNSVGTEEFVFSKIEGEDFIVAEELTKSVIELNDEFEAPPSFNTEKIKPVTSESTTISDETESETFSADDKAENKTVSDVKSKSNDCDEFEAPPAFRKMSAKAVKPAAVPDYEDEFETPPPFKKREVSESASSEYKRTSTGSSKFKGSLADKWK